MEQTDNTTTAPTETQPKKSGPITINHKQEVTKKRKIILLNTLTFLVIAFAFYWLLTKYFHIGDKDYTESAQVEEYINPINTRVSAYIKEIRFIEHQSVKQGDTLVLLDDSEIRTQVEQAEAAYLSALAAKEVTLSARQTASNSIGVFDSNIQGAQARLWNAEQNKKRFQHLVDAEAVTQQQYDQVSTEYEAAKAAYEALKKQQTTSRLSVSEIDTRLALNEADIKRTKAMLDMAQLNLSYTVIRAPYDGTIGRRYISVGQLLNPSQQITTIVRDNDKWVTANFLESQMPDIQIGTILTMTADAVRGVQFEGVVTAISAATGNRYSSMPTDNSTGNFVKVQQRIPVRIEFTPANKEEEINRLKAGMNMNVQLKNK
ncbi:MULTISPECIES: HlyD family secretion protein [unclassified Myroides]|uniref:HlyD family secretion protein n=1 Tax=unclassified Myroides TaxID=2642485 RepID=UPI0015F8532C|nr:MULTISPECIES: HlyD family secretion protein [unclassified Myroides]MBB1149766.1 HlyD family secretion protein [Myroides sp. NP-2]MDM1408623.1 HlyD family secretion protein [Myroides sp. DF42-4-2]